MNVRELDSSEWPLLRDMRLGALRDTPDAYGAGLEHETQMDEEGYSSLFNASAWFIAEDNGSKAGLAGGTPSWDGIRSERDGTFVWVATTSRGSEVGSHLIKAVEDWAVGDDAVTVAFWATERSGARNFYERLGYREDRSMPLLRDSSISAYKFVRRVR